MRLVFSSRSIVYNRSRKRRVGGRKDYSDYPKMRAPGSERQRSEAQGERGGSMGAVGAGWGRSCGQGRM